MNSPNALMLRSWSWHSFNAPPDPDTIYVNLEAGKLYSVKIQ